MAGFNRLIPLGKAIRDTANARRKGAAADLRDDWKANAHVITGEYRDSIHDEDQGDNVTLVVADAPYAPFEEYGTRYRPGHPAFTPAVERARAAYPGKFGRLI